jgi:hypothetical protein
MVASSCDSSLVVTANLHCAPTGVVSSLLLCTMENGRWLQAVLTPVLLLQQTCAVLTDVVSSLTLHSMENGRCLQAVGIRVLLSQQTCAVLAVRICFDT